MEIGKRIAGLFRHRKKKTRKKVASRNHKGYNYTDDTSILYHGGGKKITDFDIRKCKRGAYDFGKGFYTSVCEKYANIYILELELKDLPAVMNKFAFDIEEADKLGFNIKIYKEADMEWFEFVKNNRTVKNFTHPYDIVIGPTADFNIDSIFKRLEEGENAELLLKEASEGVFPNQVFFHNEESFKLLVHCE